MTGSEKAGCLTRLKPMLESLLIFSNFVLAACTFYLAWTTSTQAKATSEQVAATLDQVKASRDALEEQSRSATQFYEGLKMFRQVVDITTENQRSLARLAQSGGKVEDILTTEALKLPEVLGIRTRCKFEEKSHLSYRLTGPCDHIEVQLQNPGMVSTFHATAVFSAQTTQPERYCHSVPQQLSPKEDGWFVIHLGKCFSGASPANIDFTVTGARNAT